MIHSPNPSSRRESRKTPDIIAQHNIVYRQGKSFFFLWWSYYIAARMFQLGEEGAKKHK